MLLHGEPALDPASVDPGSLVAILTAPSEVEVLPAARRPIPDCDVRVRTLFSGTSTGTELTLYRGTNPDLDRHWDPVRRLFVDEPNGAATPSRTVGYAGELALECRLSGPADQVLPKAAAPLEAAGVAR